MTQLLLVAFAGAVGTVARFGVSRWLAVPLDSFPWSTLAVNVIGSFLFGIAWVVFERAAIGGPAARLATVSLLAQNLGALFGVFAGLGLARAVANS